VECISETGIKGNLEERRRKSHPMDNIQGAVVNPKFMKISDFAPDRLTG